MVKLLYSSLIYPKRASQIPRLYAVFCNTFAYLETLTSGAALRNDVYDVPHAWQTQSSATYADAVEVPSTAYQLSNIRCLSVFISSQSSVPLSIATPHSILGAASSMLKRGA